ncbi:MAG TPA: DEAD/DEAH box helicase family protein [Pirellulales bacterium]|nr:DEAD/DEAH box helicase family protein [Pirellulales bacterium]
MTSSYSIPELIINSPFREPAAHWSYDRASRLFTRKAARRPAGYIMATPGSQSFDDPGVFVELPLVNQIRQRVKAWRERPDNPYAGVNGITRRLLEHWRDAEQREDRQFFFCQLEAIETLIWLVEAPAAERQGIDVPGDGGDFTRWCSKMATGSGKTIVMAMLIAWHVLNKATYPQDKRFARNVLVVAPGLTVKSRLQVLVPGSEGNYYDLFAVVPPGLTEKLRQGKVLVRNWHALDWESEEQIARRKGVDKRGAKSDEAYVRDVLGEMASARNLLVINDEAHHAWRVAGHGKPGASKAEVETATKWIGGLDRIHRARGILACHDLSATPFAPTGRQSTEEMLFGWIVSDFGLADAIESGLVKTPRVVVRDDGRLAPDYKSRLYHIYNDPEVKDDLNRKAEPFEPLPDLVTNGYYLLGKDWLETATRWREQGEPTPPVMITVANRTETAARVKFAFDRAKIQIDELARPERTLHIDSKVLEMAEAQEEPTALTGENEGDDDDQEQPVRKLTKQQQAELLRRTVDTVGQVGQPGEQIQAVISVGMLSEGWDTKTVTHIMGLRAFSSQLLCEQVVGRGLRRTSYDVNEATGMYEPEYVNIFGVPFTFLPHEEGDGPPPPPPPPKTKIEALAERRQFEIVWPNIVRIDHVLQPRLALDWSSVEPLVLDAFHLTMLAELAPVIEGKPDVTRLAQIELESLARRFRAQKIAFEAARDVFDLARPSWRGNREFLLGQLVGLVERFIQSDRLQIVPDSFAQDELRRRLVIALNMTKLVQHLWNAVREKNTERLVPVFDDDHPRRSTADMQPWYTGKPHELTRRSHVNFCVFDSTWEATEAFELDRNDLVEAWAKNDHLGFEVLYSLQGVVRKYRPDFLIRLRGGTLLVLEVKGQDSVAEQTKRRYLAEWVEAVNGVGDFGRWACDVSRHPKDVAEILERHARSHR